MTFVPISPSALERNRIRVEITLEHIYRRIELLELAQHSPLAWAALEALAFVFCLESPAEELGRQCFAALMLECSLSYYEGERARLEAERTRNRYRDMPPL